MAEFISGRILSNQFYQEIIKPLLAGIPHDACLIGEGSDVLGYDQPISMDHDWGPRLTLFVANECEVIEMRNKIIEKLPDTFKGFPTRKDEETSNIEVTTISNWLKRNLKIDDIDALEISDWLSFSQQHLLQFTGGVVFANSLGSYDHAKKILAWYPDDVWRWIMAAQWYFIWGSERLIFRTTEAGDILGGQLIVGKLVRLIVEMIFIQNKAYKPYDKWLGSAFKKIDTNQRIEKAILEILSDKDTANQIKSIQKLLFNLGDRHNSLSLTEIVQPKITNYEVGVNNAVRPYKIFNSSDFKDACINSIQDIALKELVYVGALDQMTNPSDALINFTDWRSIIKNGFQAQLGKGK